MKITDFNKYNEILLKVNQGVDLFCTSCFQSKPSYDEDGYTNCCNDTTMESEEALIQAKFTDIKNFLTNNYGKNTFEIKPSFQKKTLRQLAHKTNMYNIHIQGNEEFCVNLYDDNEEIIDIFQRFIKSLNKKVKKISSTKLYH